MKATYWKLMAEFFDKRDFQDQLLLMLQRELKGQLLGICGEIK